MSLQCLVVAELNVFWGEFQTEVTATENALLLKLVLVLGRVVSAIGVA